MVTPETVEQLIESSRPRRHFLRRGNLALLALGALLGMMLATPQRFGEGGLQSWMLFQLILLGLVVVVVLDGLSQRRRGRLMLEGFEATQLQDWERARNALVPLLSRPIRRRSARTESLLALAAVAEAGKNYDASQRVYESLLGEHAGDPVQLHTARVALAATMLRTGQTADAVDLIDQLTRVKLPGPLQAQVELLSLYREVVMGQAADALTEAPRRRELFREYLGTRAGYGYGLLAAAFDRAGQDQAARDYWHDATLLLRTADLIDRFAELEPVAQRYPAVEWPL